MPDGHVPRTPGTYPSDFKSEFWNYPENWVESAATAAPYLGWGGGLGLAAGIGTGSWGTAKLRSMGRQALTEDVARRLARQYGVPVDWVINNLGNHPTDLTALPALQGPFRTSADMPRMEQGVVGGLLNEISARQRGNSILNLLTRAGRESGARRRAVEMNDLMELARFAIGTPENPGAIPTTMRNRSNAYQAAAEAFGKDPITAPVPGKRPPDYVPPDIDLNSDLTRAGIQEAAGRIAESSRPGVLSSKVVGTASRPFDPEVGRPRLRFRNVAAGIGVPLLAGFAQFGIPWFRANEWEKQMKAKGLDPESQRRDLEAIGSTAAKTNVPQVKQGNVNAQVSTGQLRNYFIGNKILASDGKSFIPPTTRQGWNTLILSLNGAKSFLDKKQKEGFDPAVLKNGYDMIAEIQRLAVSSMKAAK